MIVDAGSFHCCSSALLDLEGSTVSVLLIEKSSCFQRFRVFLPTSLCLDNGVLLCGRVVREGVRARCFCLLSA